MCEAQEAFQISSTTAEPAYTEPVVSKNIRCGIYHTVWNTRSEGTHDSDSTSPPAKLKNEFVVEIEEVDTTHLDELRSSSMHVLHCTKPVPAGQRRQQRLQYKREGKE